MRTPAPVGSQSPVGPWLLMAPALLLLGGLFLAPLAVVFWQSLGCPPVDGSLGCSATLLYWRRALADPEFLAALALSLRIALISTLLSLAAGLLLALALRAVAPGAGIVRLFARLPLVVPHLVAGYLVLLLLGRSGLVARLSFAGGLIQAPADFPILVGDAFGWSIIFAYVWKEAPFIVLLVYPLLGLGVADWLGAARTLGATPWQALRHVVLPLIWPALAAGGAIIFAYSFGAFELPLLLGRTFPRALPVLAYERYLSPDLSQRPEAMVISLVLAVGALAASGWYLRSYRRLERALSAVRRDAHG